MQRRRLGKLWMVGLCAAVVGCQDAQGGEIARDVGLETEAIVADLIHAGYSEADIDIDDDGTIVVQRDIMIDPETYGGPAETRFRQFHTNNLIASSYEQIEIYASRELQQDHDFVDSIKTAIDKWNASPLALRFRFSYVTCPPFPDFDNKFGSISIRPMEAPPACGTVDPSNPTDDTYAQSSFPTARGAPGGEIKVNPCVLTAPKKAQVYTLMHEIGHAVGLRHTDYATRASCTGGTGESADPDGAHPIDGTPGNDDAAPGQSPDPASVMNACFSTPALAEDPSWSAADVKAINHLYGRSGS